MIFLGNGQCSQDMVNDRIIEFLNIINHLGGLQQGLNSKKVLNKYNKRAKKFGRQIKFDLLTNKVGELKLYNSPEYLIKVREAFEKLHDALRNATEDELYDQRDRETRDQEEDAPF